MGIISIQGYHHQQNLSDVGHIGPSSQGITRFEEEEIFSVLLVEGLDIFSFQSNFEHIKWWGNYPPAL